MNKIMNYDQDHSCILGIMVLLPIKNHELAIFLRLRNIQLRTATSRMWMFSVREVEVEADVEQPYNARPGLRRSTRLVARPTKYTQ